MNNFHLKLKHIIASLTRGLKPDFSRNGQIHNIVSTPLSAVKFGDVPIPSDILYTSRSDVPGTSQFDVQKTFQITESTSQVSALIDILRTPLEDLRKMSSDVPTFYFLKLRLT